MSWESLATQIQRFRHAATLAVAGAVALVLTLNTQRGYFRLGAGSALKYFTFVFFVVTILAAIGFTILLVIAETKAEAARRGPQPEFPVAIAREVTPPSQRVPAVTSPTVTAPPKEPERDISDGPSFLR